MKPAFKDDWATVYSVDALTGASLLPEKSVHTIITSPLVDLLVRAGLEIRRRSVDAGFIQFPRSLVKRLAQSYELRCLDVLTAATGTLGHSFSEQTGDTWSFTASVVVGQGKQCAVTDRLRDAALVCISNNSRRFGASDKLHASPTRVLLLKPVGGLPHTTALRGSKPQKIFRLPAFHPQVGEHCLTGVSCIDIRGAVNVERFTVGGSRQMLPQRTTKGFLEKLRNLRRYLLKGYALTIYSIFGIAPDPAMVCRFFDADGTIRVHRACQISQCFTLFQYSLLGDGDVIIL